MARLKAVGKLGSGKRFAAIEHKAAKEYGSEEAGEKVAAFVGNRKYGKKKMHTLAMAARRGR